MSEGNFFKLFRRRGFSETMGILDSFENDECVQAKFFEKLSAENSYPNTYFRVKNELLQNDLIAYKLNANNEKVIYLTNRGKKVWNLVQDIENVLTV